MATNIIDGGFKRQEVGEGACKEDDGCPTEKAVLQRFWREHHKQAATEAAKATGTAGEPMTMSYVQNVPDHCDRITWRGAYYHLKEGAEAARQPAPVVAVKTWQERMKESASEGWTTLSETHMKAEIADLRAALAARSQP